jgi:anthranilate/para-aminobenzoate synthase component I
MRFMLADSVVAFDHVRRTMSLIGPRRASSGCCGARRRRRGRPRARRRRRRGRETERERYMRRSSRPSEHIAAGDAFQIVPSQRVRRRTAPPPSRSTGRCAAVNPSPYMFLLDSAAPARRLLARDARPLDLDGTCELRPIAGTRPRGATAPRTTRWRRADGLEKERAEHVMLVDLGPQRPGPRLRAGQRAVARSMEVERYSHVMHIVSRVFGQIRRTATRRAAAAHLPGRHRVGRAQGAGDADHLELEGRRRGAYAGAVGYLGFGGDMDTCIAHPHDRHARRRRLPAGGRRDRGRLRPGGARGVHEQAGAPAARHRPGRDGVYGP